LYQLEKMGSASFYLKAIGKFPPIEAERFVKDFKDKASNLKEFSVIVDITDASHLDSRSLNIILELLKENNEKLVKSAFVISNNPPLSVELSYILEKAGSPKRKIVNNLEEAKDWLGVNKILIKKN
jgi:anti-anti-sigma regulatory factor